MYVLGLLFLIFSSLGCSLDASILSIEPTPVAMAPDVPRTEVDFVHAEVVTTTAGTAGYEIRAAVGEISEKQESTTVGGWKVEGVFYE